MTLGTKSAVEESVASSVVEVNLRLVGHPEVTPQKRRSHLNPSAIVGAVAIRGTADFFCSALPAQ